MWILVVLSAMHGTDEVKMTHYDLYKTEKSCLVAEAKLEEEFTHGEEAVCMFSKGIFKNPKPKKDNTIKSDKWGLY